MQDRPDASELLLAVAAWLVEDLLPVAPREQRFAVRVAAHACAMVAREWEQDRLLDREARREADAELARAIRAGELDDRWDETVELLREAVRVKLAVARPGWDAVADDGLG